MAKLNLNPDQAEALRLLRESAEDGGITAVDATINHNFPKLQQRVEELRRFGFVVSTRELDSGEVAYSATYDLVEEDIVVAGCTLRLGTRKGFTARTHKEAKVSGMIPEDVLREAEAAAAAAYMQVLESYAWPFDVRTQMPWGSK